MQILIESTPNYLNMGDLAMLQVCLRRLRALWPDARLLALTADPEALRRNCPGVDPVFVDARDLWFRSVPFLKSGLETRLRQRFPWLLGQALLYQSKDNPERRAVLREFLHAVRRTDLFVISGMGSFTSDFGPDIVNMLEMIALMKSLRVLTVAFSQGIGPMDRNSDTWATAQRTLARLDFVALREGRLGPEILRELGVPEDCLAVTGDDAVELAYHAGVRPASNCIGVNLRVSGYSGVAPGDEARLAAVLHRLSANLGAVVLPVPISHVPEESDLASFVRMFPEYPAEALSTVQLTPEWTIGQIARCRIVITGAYHAAVFALSQGIPAVCVAKSEYYRTKFLGLAAQFGSGCRVIPLEPGMESVIAGAVTELWQTGESYRPALLEAARDQIEASKAAWAELRWRVPSRRHTLFRPGAEQSAVQTHDWYRYRSHKLSTQLRETLVYLREVEAARDFHRDRNQPLADQLEHTAAYLRDVEQARDWHRDRAEPLAAKLEETSAYLREVENARDWHRARAERVEAELQRTAELLGTLQKASLPPQPPDSEPTSGV